MLNTTQAPQRAPKTKLREHSTEDVEHESPDEFLGRRILSDIEAYLKPFARYPVFRSWTRDRAEITRLFEQYRHGATAKERLEARDMLVYANRLLVFSIARSLLGRGMLMPDLMQEGMIGLMTAIDKYEVDRGFAFSTHATWWIRQAMTRAVVEQSSRAQVRLPVHAHDCVQLLRKNITLFLQTESRPPTNFELLMRVKESETKVSQEMTLAQVARYRRILEYGYVSLAQPIKVGIGDRQIPVELGDAIPDRRIRPDTHAEARRMLEHYEQALARARTIIAQLPGRLPEVLSLRFGLDGVLPLTLEQVSVRFNVTRERIRQIEAKGLELLQQQRTGIDAQTLEQLVNTHEELQRLVAGGAS